MSFLHHSAIGTVTDEEKRMNDVIFAAQDRGYEFIEVHLNPAAKIQMNSQTRITGARVVRSYESGVDKYNIPQYDFVVQGGDIEFKPDGVKRKMVAFVLDDKDKGVVSPVGFNRDLLASHIDTFTVPDPEIAADIRKRADKILQKKARDEVEKEDASAEEYDQQIKALEAKKAAALDKTTESEPPKIEKKEKSKRKSTKTPEERKAWGEKMKAAREAKKKERVASLPKEEHAQHQATSKVGAA